MLPVNWMRCSGNKNRPFTSRKKAGSSTIQVWDDPLRKNGEKKSRNPTISGLFPDIHIRFGGDKRDRTADLLNAICSRANFWTSRRWLLAIQAPFCRTFLIDFQEPRGCWSTKLYLLLTCSVKCQSTSLYKNLRVCTTSCVMGTRGCKFACLPPQKQVKKFCPSSSGIQRIGYHFLYNVGVKIERDKKQNLS